MNNATPKYHASEAEQKKIENGLSYHPVQGDNQAERYQSNRHNAQSFATTLTQNCPASRELSLALTALQEALMWANAAIAVNESPPAPTLG